LEKCLFFINKIFTISCYKLFCEAEERYGAYFIHSTTGKDKGKGKGVPLQASTGL